MSTGGLDAFDGAARRDFVIRRLGRSETPPYALLLDADPSRGMVDDYLPRGECYVAVVAESVVGVCVLVRTRPGTAEIVNVAVAPAHQGRGIGKSLIRHAIERARELGVRTVEIGTGNSSVGQLALYQKCGFRIVSVDRDFFVRHYNEPIIENGIPCRDMIRLCLDLHSSAKLDNVQQMR